MALDCVWRFEIYVSGWLSSLFPPEVFLLSVLPVTLNYLERHQTSMLRSLEAWRHMEHCPHELHLSIHNYADSGVIHNVSLSHFSPQCTSV